MESNDPAAAARYVGQWNRTWTSSFLLFSMTRKPQPWAGRSLPITRPSFLALLGRLRHRFLLVLEERSDGVVISHPPSQPLESLAQTIALGDQMQPIGHCVAGLPILFATRAINRTLLTPRASVRETASRRSQGWWPRKRSSTGDRPASRRRSPIRRADPDASSEHCCRSWLRCPAASWKG